LKTVFACARAGSIGAPVAATAPNPALNFMKSRRRIIILPLSLML
jgi:hypothetical protein